MCPDSRPPVLSLIVQSTFLLLATLVLCSVHAEAQPLLTRNVFVVNIDGIRNNEALESARTNMPFLWDSLRPGGTIYSNFQNRGITVTNSGHSTIVTGVRQMLPNNSGIATPVRPQEPTMAEYYRKELGIPREKVYFISGKTSIWRYPVSLFPGFGYPVAPTITLTSSKDTLTWDSTRVIMDRDHPSLAYVLFAQVDAEGHTADAVKYFGAIRRVDSLIFLLWQKIQTDSIYRDRTTMLVTSDHGRHDDLHGGWQAHGDYCHGCRHVPFFAIGPDIRAGEVIETVRDHIDIAPTVAYLLGFHAPLAQGTIMAEMLVAPPPARGGGSLSGTHEQNLSGAVGVARSPSVAAGRTGIHVAFAAGGPGITEVLYVRSTDSGATWEPARPLFSRPGTEYLGTAITLFADSCLFAATTGYRYFEVDSSYGWILEGRRSIDRGATWEAPLLLDTLTTISTQPSLASAGTRITLSAMMGYRVWNYISTDGGATFTGKQVHGASSTTPTCTLLDTTPYVAWRHINKDSLPYWNILYDRQAWRTRDHPVTQNDTDSYSYLPSLTGDGDSVLQLLYVNLADASSGNEWSLRHQRKSGTGDEWEPPREIAPGRTAWSPVIRQTASGDLHSVWADLEAGQWSMRSSISTDHGLTWEPPVQRTSPQAFALNPAAATTGDTVCMVWEDWRSGNPEIYFTQYSVYVTGRIWHGAGWNLMSLPVDPPDRSGEGLGLCEPTFCYLYGYGESGYIQVDSLQLFRGYWWRVNTAGVATVRGRPLNSDTVTLRAGWNLVGGMGDTVSVSSVASIPQGNIHWPVFLYGSSGYYPSREFLPGRGHWVKAGEPGLLVFPTPGGRH